VAADGTCNPAALWNGPVSVALRRLDSGDKHDRREKGGARGHPGAISRLTAALCRNPSAILWLMRDLLRRPLRATRFQHGWRA